jgi:hypothetical protein
VTWLILILLFAALCAPAQVREKPAPVREKRVTPFPAPQRQEFERQRRPGVAILVGVARYAPFSGFGELRYPLRDVADLASELEKQNYTVIRLEGPDASRQTILDAIAQSGPAAARSGGSMIFFFSGHGFEDHGVNYLALHGAVSTHLAESGLSLPGIEAEMAKAGVSRRILWIDACRNDPAKGAVSARSFARFNAATGTRALFSTAPGGVSTEDDQLQHGLFTFYLLEGLRGAASGPDGLISSRDLADYVTDAVEARSVSRGNPQVPYEGGESRGDFLIAKSREITPPAQHHDLSAEYEDLRRRCDIVTRSLNSRAGNAQLKPSILLDLAACREDLDAAQTEMGAADNSSAAARLARAKLALVRLEAL